MTKFVISSSRKIKTGVPFLEYSVYYRLLGREALDRFRVHWNIILLKKRPLDATSCTEPKVYDDWFIGFNFAITSVNVHRFLSFLLLQQEMYDV